jgi:isopenicillin N synthase-like dioxygenase
VDNVFNSAKAFFEEPLEVKMEIDIDKNSNRRGYIPLQHGAVSETHKGISGVKLKLGDMHESIDFGSKNTSYTASFTGSATEDLNNWPKQHPTLQAACENYFDDVVALGRRLLLLFALSLDLEETYFDEYTKGPACIARVIHYPPQNPMTLDYSQIGIGAHTVLPPQSINTGLGVIHDSCSR